MEIEALTSSQPTKITVFSLEKLHINNTQCQELSHTEISANQSTSKISYISQEYVYFRELVKMEKNLK